MEESAERRVSTARRAFLNFCGPTLAKGLQSSLLYMTCLGWSSWDTQCCSPAFFRFCSPRSKIPRLLRPILATSSTRSTTVSIQSRPHASYPRLPRKAPGPLASVLLTSSAISIKPTRLAHRIRLAQPGGLPRQERTHCRCRKTTAVSRRRRSRSEPKSIPWHRQRLAESHDEQHNRRRRRPRAHR